MIKENCFAFISSNKYKGCYCLNELYCKSGKCKFYQDKEKAKKKYLDTFTLQTATQINKFVDKYFRNL